MAMHLPLYLLSPEPAAKANMSGSDRATFRHLTSQQSDLDLSLDIWTAVLLLFHDHDWEISILRAALQSDPFYIGALGSSFTHTQRQNSLRALGVGEEELARITGPIGAIPAARDAHTLAISALAEIIDAYRQSLTQNTTVPHFSARAI